MELTGKRARVVEVDSDSDDMPVLVSSSDDEQMASGRASTQAAPGRSEQLQKKTPPPPLQPGFFGPSVSKRPQSQLAKASATAPQNKDKDDKKPPPFSDRNVSSAPSLDDDDDDDDLVPDLVQSSSGEFCSYLAMSMHVQ